MGGEPDLVAGNSADGPQHTVTLTKGFYLGKFEVTQAQWIAIVGTKPWDEKTQVDCALCPVTWVSWEDAQLFNRQLNLQTDDSLFYRLPTEAEWEYAARAGTSTAWSFGDDPADLRDYAWYNNNTSILNRVGLRLPNPWGLYDMHGNVAEWVEDWWIGPYPEETQIDPVNDTKPNVDYPPHKIKRGGAYGGGPLGTRSGIRGSEEPSGPNALWPDIGFRLAASLNTKTSVKPSSWGSIKANSDTEYRE